MIQRIQSVYLLLVTACAVAGLCMPIGYFHSEGIKVADFYNLWLAMSDGTRLLTPWALLVLLALVAMCSLAAFFMYKRRMLQVRLSVISGLFLVGYYIVFGVFVYMFKGRLGADFTVNWSSGLPAVALILDYLAFRNIMKDELLVRSLDRLR